jgi:hypothetical protein
MTRDMDLVRELLLDITEEKLRPDDWNEKEKYHLKMLKDIGYVEGIAFLLTSAGWEATASNPRLTWSGHEFFDTIKSKTVWEKIKKVLKDKGLDLSVETIKLVAPNVLASILK